MEAISLRKYGASDGNNIEWEGGRNGEGDGSHFENGVSRLQQ